MEKREQKLLSPTSEQFGTSVLKSIVSESGDTFDMNEESYPENTAGSCEYMFYCHLCKIKFKNCPLFCIHIMKKHRRSSKYYEGDDKKDSSSETVQDQVDCLVIPSSSHQISEEKESSEITDTQPDFETVEDQAGCQDVSSSSHQVYEEKVSAEVTDTQPDLETVQDLAGCEDVSSSSHQVYEEKESSEVTQTTSSPQSMLRDHIIQNIIEQVKSSNTQEKDSKMFEYNVENILNWRKRFHTLFPRLKYPLSSNVIIMMQAVKSILVNFCELSKDEKAVSLTKDLIEEMEDILKRHKNLQMNNCEA